MTFSCRRFSTIVVMADRELARPKDFDLDPARVWIKAPYFWLICHAGKLPGAQYLFGIEKHRHFPTLAATAPMVLPQPWSGAT